MTKDKLARLANVIVVRDWAVSGPGRARYGYWRIDTCKRTWLGRTLAEAAKTLKVPS